MNYTGSCRTGGLVQSAEVFSQRGGPVRKLASTHRYYTLRYRIGNYALRVFTPRCSGSA